VEGGKRGREGGMAGDSSGGRHRPQADGREHRRCGATGEGAGARATLVRAADRRDRAAMGLGGQRLGVGGRGGSEVAAALGC
jgi:hypothetical protein